MGSLQRTPFDERDAGRGPPMHPPSQFGSAMGPGAMSSVGRGDPRSASNMSGGRGPPQMLTGPGAAGIHNEPLAMKERERLERENDQRERAREARVERRERDMREREMREMFEERERENRHREREWVAAREDFTVTKGC